MGLVGQLADMSLDDILKIIQLSRKSGILTIRSRGQEWAIAFRQGEIVRLSSALVGPALLAELLDRQLVEQETFESLLKLREDGGNECFTTLLERRCGISSGTLIGICRDVAERFLQELTAWEDGEFSFELEEGVSARTEVAGPDHLVLDDRACNAAPVSCNAEVKATPSEVLTPPAQPDPTTLKTDPHGDSGCLEGRLIWIVVGDPYLRQVLDDIFQATGATVMLFETTADFWVSLKKARLSGILPLAVIDAHMPLLAGGRGYGGLGLLEKIRAAYPEVTVLPLCEREHGGIASDVRNLGYAETFVKPQRSDPQSVAGIEHLPAIARSLERARQPIAGSALDELKGDPDEGNTRGMERGDMSEARSFRNSPGLHLLKGMLEELNNPALGGEIILLVLRFASEVMNRAVIFSVKDDQFVGIGQFGVVLEDGETDAAIRNIAIPQNGGSVLGALLDKPCCRRARYGDGAWDQTLRKALGGGVPADIFLGPIVSEGRVVAVLYGDNLPEQRAVGNTEALEIFLSQAGVAMEKALLEGKLLGSHHG